MAGRARAVPRGAIAIRAGSGPCLSRTRSPQIIPRDPAPRKKAWAIENQFRAPRRANALATGKEPPLNRPELHRETLQNVRDLPPGHARALKPREERDVGGRAPHA